MHVYSRLSFARCLIVIRSHICNCAQSRSHRIHATDRPLERAGGAAGVDPRQALQAVQRLLTGATPRALLLLDAWRTHRTTSTFGLVSMRPVHQPHHGHRWHSVVLRFRRFRCSTGGTTAAGAVGSSAQSVPTGASPSPALRKSPCACAACAMTSASRQISARPPLHRARACWIACADALHPIYEWRPPLISGQFKPAMGPLL